MSVCDPVLLCLLILFLSLSDHELIALGPIIIHACLLDFAIVLLVSSLLFREVIVVEKADLLRRIEYVVFLV